MAICYDNCQPSEEKFLPPLFGFVLISNRINKFKKKIKIKLNKANYNLLNVVNSLVQDVDPAHIFIIFMRCDWSTCFPFP